LLYPTEHSPCPNPQSYTGALTKHSLRQLIGGFILTYKLEGKSPLTIEDHQRKLNRFVSYLEQHCVSHITPAVIRGFLGYVRETYHLDAATVQRYLVSCKAFFRWVTEEGFAKKNPTVHVKVGSIAKKIIKALSPEHMRLLLNSLNGNSLEEVRNKVIILMLLDCGLRISEIANLRLEDIDIANGSLTVMGKGAKQRLLRMGLLNRKTLWKYKTLRYDSSPWLWINKRGERLKVSGIKQMVRKSGKKIGIRLHPHLLRHTFAISFLRNGANTFECQYALGHSSLEMTRRYTQTLNYEDVFRKHEIASPVDNLRG